jgi:hypothetical protein
VRLAPRADINKEDFAAVDAWIDSVMTALGQLNSLKPVGLAGACVCVCVCVCGMRLLLLLSRCMHVLCKLQWLVCNNACYIERGLDIGISTVPAS